MSDTHFVARRGELMAELFLQELSPGFVARVVGSDLGFDFFAGFRNTNGGVNIVAIQVKATAAKVSQRYPLTTLNFKLLAESNVPGLLLLADVKRNRLFYFLANQGHIELGRSTVMVPITEADEEGTAALVRRIVAKW